MNSYRDFIESEAIRIAQRTPGGVFPDVDFNIPAEYHDEVKTLLRAAAAADTFFGTPAWIAENPDVPAADYMAPFGKWHRAANLVQADLRADGVAYMGSWSHRALMRVAATMEI